MPDRTYRASHTPPTLADRFLAHTTTSFVAAWWIVVGVVLAVAAGTDLPLTSTLVRIAPLVAFPVAAGMLGGGLGLLWSTLTTTRSASKVWDIQQNSCLIAGIAWGAYAFVIGAADPWNWIAIGHGACMGIIAFGGFVTSKLVERQGRETVRSQGGRA